MTRPSDRLGGPALQRRLVIGAILLVALVAAVGSPPPASTPLFGIPGLTITGAGTWTGVSMFAAYLLKEWRETRKLSSEDRLARREGYAKQVANLQVENRDLRADLMASERLHDDYRRLCQMETDQLRSHVRGLEDELAGMKRTLGAYSKHLSESEGTRGGPLPDVILPGRES